jgi:hypothetical protein
MERSLKSKAGTLVMLAARSMSSFQQSPPL